MVNRFVVGCAVLAALVFAAPAHALVFPFLEPDPLGASADRIVALDFDGDGWADVAGVDGENGKATLVLNGEDDFAPAQTAALGATSVPDAIAAADLDGDGRDELLATLGDTGSLLVFKGGDRLGTPTVISLRAPQAARATAVAAADVDGDGDRDVVAAFGDSATVLLNDGHGALTPSAGAVTIPAPSDLKLVRLAGDNDPDLVVLSAYTLTVLAGAAGAGFGTPVSYELGAEGSAIDVADVNGDGRPDIGVSYQWVGDPSSAPAFLRGTDGAGLVPVDGGAQVADALLLADFEDDGAIDRYTGGSSPAFAHGVGNFGLLTSLAPYDVSWQMRLAAADFDHDGKLDVASLDFGSHALSVSYSTGPQLVPSDANTDFGDSAGRGNLIAVPIRNEGGGIARNLQAVVDGDQDDFAVDLYGCRGIDLAVDGQCWIRVSFVPKTLGDHAADIGLVAEDSSIIWTVTFTGTSKAAAPATPEATPTNTLVIGTGHVTVRPAPIRSGTKPPIAAPVAAVRPGVPVLTRPTLASLRRDGLHFTQQFASAQRVTWTLEYHGKVLARLQRVVTMGRTSVTLKLTAAGKRALAKHRPATLTLRTKGTLERVTTVKLR